VSGERRRERRGRGEKRGWGEEERVEERGRGGKNRERGVEGEEEGLAILVNM
jgi:hypothetical protein